MFISGDSVSLLEVVVIDSMTIANYYGKPVRYFLVMMNSLRTATMLRLF